MWSSDLKEQQIWEIVSFVHSVARPGTGPPAPGDAAAGKRIFDTAGCSQCHMIAGKGGTLGPDLSGVALRRFTPQIREAIVDPDATVDAAFQTVKVTLAQGRKIT